MKTINIILLYLLICSTECSSQRIISKELPSNPTSYIFKIRINDARFSLSKALEKQGNMSFYIHDIYFYGTWKRASWPEVATNALSGKDNKYDVYFEVSVDTSNIYHGKENKAFGYELKCVAHFTGIDSNVTKLEIRTLEAKVHLRDRFLPSLPHFVNNPVYKIVIPTTIEEYKVLRCFGAELGVINQMPILKI